MTEDEEMYRLMNEEDPWYMGPRSNESNSNERRDYKRTSDRKKAECRDSSEAKNNESLGKTLW